MFNSHMGVTSITVLGAGTTHFAFCDVHVGFVHPALTAASTRNSIAATMIASLRQAVKQKL